MTLGERPCISLVRPVQFPAVSSGAAFLPSVDNCNEVNCYAATLAEVNSRTPSGTAGQDG
jgi:hypothetical protein